MIFNIVGYGVTGSSAYGDLIREFDGFQSCGEGVELQLLKQPDGILDLHYHLVTSARMITVNTAIRRFIRAIDNPRNNHVMKLSHGRYKELTQDYVNSLIDIRWQGTSSFDPEDLRSPWLKGARGLLSRVIVKLGKSVLHKKYFWPPKETRYFAMPTEEEFTAATQRYLRLLLESMGFDLSENLLLEQATEAAFPLDGAQYFGEIRTIVVDRDPRDVFLLTNYHYKNSSFMPNNQSVEDYVKFYLREHSHRTDDPSVCYVNFEDLIYDYDRTVEKVAAWLGNPAHVRKGDFFKPEYSVNNTQAWKKMPGHEKEVAYIEEHLADYLFPFERYEGKISFTPVNTGFFSGQSSARVHPE